MGRGRKTRNTAAPTVVGPTPATEEQAYAMPIQKRQAAQDAELGVDAAAASQRKQPAKLMPVNFFTAPPRTEILAEKDENGVKDMFKQRAAAPANLGEISGSEYLPPDP